MADSVISLHHVYIIHKEEENEEEVNCLNKIWNVDSFLKLYRQVKSHSLSRYEANRNHWMGMNVTCQQVQRSRLEFIVKGSMVKQNV